MSKTLLSKITGLCLAALAALMLFPVYASAQDREVVTINMTDVPLSQVMREIEKKTDFVFLNKDVDVNRKVSINVTEKPVAEVLEILFAGKGVDYRIESGHIVISNRSSETDRGGYRTIMF